MQKVSLCNIPKDILEELSKGKATVKTENGGQKVKFYVEGKEKPIYSLCFFSPEKNSEMILTENNCVSAVLPIDDRYTVDLTELTEERNISSKNTTKKTKKNKIIYPFDEICEEEDKRSKIPQPKKRENTSTKKAKPIFSKSMIETKFLMKSIATIGLERADESKNVDEKIGILTELGKFISKSLTGKVGYDDIIKDLKDARKSKDVQELRRAIANVANYDIEC